MPDRFIVSNAIIEKISKLSKPTILIYLHMCYKRGCKELVGHEVEFEYDVIKFTQKDLEEQCARHDTGHNALRALSRLGVIKRVGTAKYKVW